MFPRPHCVCAVCAHTLQCLSVGWRTHVFLLLSQRQSSERHSLKTRNSDRVCVGVIHRRSVRRTPHSSHSECVCVCLGPACFVFSSPQKKKTAARVFFSAAAAGEGERASEVQLHYGCVCLIRQVLVRLPIDYRLIWVIRLVWTDVDVLPPELETNAVSCWSEQRMKMFLFVKVIDYLIHVGGAAVGLINLPVNFLIN